MFLCVSAVLDTSGWCGAVFCAFSSATDLLFEGRKGIEGSNRCDNDDGDLDVRKDDDVDADPGGDGNRDGGAGDGDSGTFLDVVDKLHAVIVVFVEHEARRCREFVLMKVDASVYEVVAVTAVVRPFS